MSYFKPNTRKAKKVALFIKGITGALGTTSIVNGDPKIGLGVFILGAIANELVNLFSNAEDPNTPL